MELFNNLSPTLLPGQRLLKVKGCEAAEKYPMPRDCETVLFDEDEDYLYIKKTDTNGGVILLRYKLEEDPIPHFDPKKYVTIDDFSKFKEEMLNGFNNLQQALTNGQHNANSGFKSNGSGKQSNKPNTGIDQPSASVQ